MKSAIYPVLAALALVAPRALSAAEVSATLAPAASDTTDYVYAQVCLTNDLDRTVLVGTSWFDEGHNYAWIPPGGEHIYQLKVPASVTTESGTVQLPIDRVSQQLNVLYRERGVFTQFSASDLTVPFVAQASVDCDAMPKYDFVYGANGWDVELVTAAKPGGAN